MSAVAHASRSRAAFVLYLLLWAWMVGLSALVLVNFRVAGDLAGQSQVDSALRQLQVLEGRLAEFADDVQTLQARPEAATTAALQEALQDTPSASKPTSPVSNSRWPATPPRRPCRHCTARSSSSRHSARPPRARPQRRVPPGRRRRHRHRCRFPSA